MGIPDLCSTQVSHLPTKAPTNYRELDPWVEVKDWQAYGAGIPLREVPGFRRWWWQEIYLDSCGECDSNNALCIYADNMIDISGKWDNYELECLDCGKYTVRLYS